MLYYAYNKKYNKKVHTSLQWLRQNINLGLHSQKSIHTITWANIDLFLYCHLVSPVHNVLISVFCYISAKINLIENTM